DIPTLFKTAADAVGWSKDSPPPQPSPARGERAKLVGRGIAIAERFMGGGVGCSDVTVNPDGTVTAISSAPDNGTGTLTVVAAVVAETWGIPIEQVNLVHGDTDALPIDTEAGASRMTNVAGHAALAASDKVKEQL